MSGGHLLETTLCRWLAFLCAPALVDCGSAKSTANDAATQPDALAGPDSSDASSCTVGGRSTIYLNFDGVVVQKSAIDDARANQSTLVAASSQTFPRYLSWRPDRETHLSIIMDRLTTALASFPIELTRVRPATGDYRMIVFGGSFDLTMGASSSSWSFATTDCGHRDANDVGFVFDKLVPAYAAGAALNVIGHFAGLDTSTTAGDCMQATPGSPPCVFEPAAMISLGACVGTTLTQDEPSAMVAAFQCSD
jgi:hypothetical protein